MTRKCDKCGSDRIHWRCTNNLENTTKYKCLDCGNIIVERKADTTIDEERYDAFRKQMKKLPLKISSRKPKPMKKEQVNLKKEPRNYSRTPSGKYNVKKVKEGKHYYYGTYETEDQARKVVMKMRECDWDMDKLEKIRGAVIGKC